MSEFVGDVRKQFSGGWATRRSETTAIRRKIRRKSKGKARFGIGQAWDPGKKSSYLSVVDANVDEAGVVCNLLQAPPASSNLVFRDTVEMCFHTSLSSESDRFGTRTKTRPTVSSFKRPYRSVVGAYLDEGQGSKRHKLFFSHTTYFFFQNENNKYVF